MQATLDQLNTALLKAVGAYRIPTTGRILYVCSTGYKPTSSITVAAANAVGYGDSPKKPLATIDYAIGLCVANRGDVIVVMPSHVETVSTAAFIAADVSGVTILGLGAGRNRPVLTWSATDSTITVTGTSTRFINMVFGLTGIDAVVTGFSVDAADVAFEDCEFITNSGTAGCVTGITVGATTTSPRFRVSNCRFRGPATNTGTTSTAAITLTAGIDFEIINSYFTGKQTQAITNGSAILGGEITACRFVTYTGTKSINMHASSTPFITNCRFNVPSGTAPIVAAAGFVAGNVYSAAAGVTAGTASTF